MCAVRRVTRHEVISQTVGGCTYVAGRRGPDMWMESRMFRVDTPGLEVGHPHFGRDVDGKSALAA